MNRNFAPAVGPSAHSLLGATQGLGRVFEVWTLVLIWTCATGGWQAIAREPVVASESPPAESDYALPRPGRPFVFPKDHGSHPRFRIEWWYVTGHLWDQASNRFGFQVTFFRHTNPPTPVGETETPAFGTRQFFLAHAALLEVRTGNFVHQERLNREGWDAGASTHGLQVWNGNWSLGETSEGLRLRASVRAEAAWDLVLRPRKPVVVFGQDGVSRKGAAPEAASHYLSFTRIEVEGQLAVGGGIRTVHGQAWMDHEFSSSQIGEGQVGWDWVSIQLADQREVMAYRMRRSDGTTDPFSALAWVDAQGKVTSLARSDFELTPIGEWRSPRSGATYPSGWRLRAHDPAEGRETEYRLEPLARDQELAGEIGSVPYWEGACRVLDVDGQEVGSAYVELTGYAGNLGARLR